MKKISIHKNSSIRSITFETSKKRHVLSMSLFNLVIIFD